MDVLVAQLVALLQMAVGKYPILMTVLGVVGFLRLLMKPLFSFLHTLVDLTPSPKDNAVLDEVEQSKSMKVLLYVLDWLGSIKLQAPVK